MQTLGLHRLQHSETFALIMRLFVRNLLANDKKARGVLNTNLNIFVHLWPELDVQKYVVARVTC